MTDASPVFNNLEPIFHEHLTPDFNSLGSTMALGYTV